MTSEDSEQFDIGTLFHSLLFAYQRATKEVLGSGSEVFVHPTLEILGKISEQEGSQLFSGKTLEEAVASFSNMLLKAKVVTNVTLKRLGNERYLLRIDGCAWARHTHKELKPKDATCPLALTVMAIYIKYLSDKVEETESKYLEDGTETEIKPFHTISFNTESPERAVSESSRKKSPKQARI